MSSRLGDMRKLRKALKPFGISIVTGRKHKCLQNAQGKNIYFMSSSPSCPYFAENTLKDLIKLNYIPRNTHL